MKIKVSNANTPNWKEVTVKSHIPEELKKLEEMARNIWWAWNYEATDLFRDLDPATWKEVGQNPVALLERLSYEKLEALTQDKVIVKRMNDVYAKFKAYVDAKPDSKRPSVAYFCMEYGLTHVLKIYSGGLGILAGDYLKEASDSNVDMCGVGFLYRYGYFSQSLSMDGQQIANYESQNFGSLPIERVMDENGQPMVVDVPYLNYFVHAYVWKVNVGRVPLYLLDTDNEMNSEFDRPITYQLYGGDWENRLKQEILLGIGGVLLLKKLGIKKDVYHCNEGHAALCNVQRLCDYVESGLTFDQALEVVRSSSLYTVHTPVPAGHDYFDEGLFGKYMGGYPQRMGISWQDLMDLGRINPGDAGERFCMSTFACNTCQEVNGVSWLHGKVSQEMFSGIWKGYFPEESHVGYVTNGVHFPTWSATEWKKLYAKHFAPNFLEDQSNEKIWEAIYNVADEEIWETRMALKYKLVDHIRKQFSESWLKNQGDPSRIVSLMEKINPNALLIGFARRFATYKRAHLLFTDLERLSKIVNNPDYPVQFLFAGKAQCVNGRRAGDIGLARGPVLLQLPVLMGIASGIAIHWKLPLGLKGGVGPARDAVQHGVQVGAFLFCPPSVDGLHGRGYSQQRGGLGLGYIHELRCRQNVLPDGILVCVVQNLLRGLAHQPVPVLGLFGGQFFIELRVHFLLLHVQTLLPKLVSAWYNEKKCRG